MASFADMTAHLNLNIQNFASNMRKAASMTSKFSADLRGTLNDGLVEPAKKSGVEFKDVARIVQGILISKVFYTGMNAIKQCASAVVDFSQQLEYAKMAYSNLFGSTDLATEFINVLKDFAATTPFSFQQSEEAAKRLLAYGIQYKNVMYVMKGVLAASSMQNNPQVIESVSRALGQIYTKGRLMNEEMRQLAEAGIPAYQILQEKLGLTQKQLQNLGKIGIPASKAINALVDGMTERFGGVVDASSKTMQGIVSNIKDNATMLASGAFEPVYNKIKSMLSVLEQFLFKMRQIFELKGLGGVFEAIVPPELRGAMREFAANIMEVHQASLRLIVALGGFLKPILEALLRVYNAFAPILITVINALAALIGIITSNATAMKWLTAALAAAAAMWVVFKVKAIASAVVAGVINLISKALAGLSTMLNFVVAHPFWSLLLTLVGVVVGLSGGFGKLSNAISGVFKKVTAFNGINPDKVLLPSQKKRTADINKFNKALDGTKDSMDDLADSTGKATKAAKSLLSFDEVFKLNEPDEGTDKGIGTGTGTNIDIPNVPDMSGIDTSSLVPKVPSFTDFAKNFVDTMVGSLKDKFASAGIGAILGGILGGVLGGPLGAKIGAIAGAIAGWFWDDIAKALGLTDVGKVALPIATSLGAIIGGIAGGPLGALVGGGIGALVGWLIDSITRGVETGDWSKMGYPIGIGVGSAIGFAVGGPGGAVIGGAIGAFAGWLFDKISTGLNTGKWDFTAVGTGLGVSIGGAIGMIVGGPAGAGIGAAIGGLIGWIGGQIAAHWGDIQKQFNEWGQDIAGAFNTAKDFVEGVWAGVSGWWQTNVWDPLGSAAQDAWGNIQSVWQNVSGWWQANVWTPLSDAGISVENVVVGAFATAHDNIQTTWQGVSGWWQTNVWGPLGVAAGALRDDMSTKFNNAKSNISAAWSTMSGWWQTNVWSPLGVAAGTLRDDISKKFNNAKSNISTAWSTVSGWFATSVWNPLSAKSATLRDDISKKFNTAKSNISTAWSTVSGWWNTNVWGPLTSKAGSTGGSIFSHLRDAKDSVVGAWKGIGDWFNTYVWGPIKSGFKGVSDWFNDRVSDIKGALNGLAQKGASITNKHTSSGGASVWQYANGGFVGNLSDPVPVGHAVGGIFNKEHIARFAEGGKAEAIIPLQNRSAMQPFVDAVSDGITASLAPIFANASNGQGQLRPLYVGTLVADERGLKELNRKMQVIQLQENTRRG